MKFLLLALEVKQGVELDEDIFVCFVIYISDDGELTVSLFLFPCRDALTELYHDSERRNTVDIF